MYIHFYGGRVGFGEEWEEDFIFDADTTEEDIESAARGLSEDFMLYCLEDNDDLYDYWYEWKESK